MSSSEPSPSVPIPWWGWLTAVICFALTVLAPRSQMLAFGVLGVGSAITCLQVSRSASIPRDRRRNFAIAVTVFAWVAAVILRSTFR